MANQYEIVFIFRSEGTEEQLKQVVSRAEEFIKKEGGVITATEPWGRRRLAFPINKQKEGVYFLLKVTAEPAVMDHLKQAYRLDETLVRVMIVTADPAASIVPTRAVVANAGTREDWQY